MRECTLLYACISVAQHITNQNAVYFETSLSVKYSVCVFYQILSLCIHFLLWLYGLNIILMETVNFLSKRNHYNEPFSCVYSCLYTHTHTQATLYRHHRMKISTWTKLGWVKQPKFRYYTKPSDFHVKSYEISKISKWLPYARCFT